MAVKVISIVIAIALTLGGCANFRLHDESRAKLATETKETYAKADVPGILDVEAKDLDALLDESLKVVRDNHGLQLDLALLSIAADRTPMADTLREAAQGLTELGFKVDGGDFGAVRAFVSAQSDKTLRSAEADNFANHVRLAKATPPPCTLGKALPLPAEWSKDLTLNPSEKRIAESHYRRYRDACEKMRAAAASATYGDGLLKANQKMLDDAKAARKKRLDDLAAQKKLLKDARADYATALGDGKTPDARCADRKAKLADAIEQKLQALKAAIDAADNLDSSASGEARIAGLLTLLEAAAGEKIDTDDADLRKAALVAQEMPSLFQDMCELISTNKKPPVSSLLMSLRHATLLADYAQQQGEMADRRIALLEEKQGLLQAQAAQWLTFADAMCSFAALSAKQPYPGARCSTFRVSDDGKLCELDGARLAGDCALGPPWSSHLKASPGPATRELYKALLAYQRVYALRARVSEIEFRLVDALHRETLSRKRLAVKDWDNLVGSAVAQLDAYFAAGLKPAEIADLIVKALGLTAIAIGVSN